MRSMWKRRKHADHHAYGLYGKVSLGNITERKTYKQKINLSLSSSSSNMKFSYLSFQKLFLWKLAILSYTRKIDKNLLYSIVFCRNSRFVFPILSDRSNSRHVLENSLIQTLLVKPYNEWPISCLKSPPTRLSRRIKQSNGMQWYPSNASDMINSHTTVHRNELN